MKGRGRVSMREISVYGVRDGKIFREQFFTTSDNGVTGSKAQRTR